MAFLFVSPDPSWPVRMVCIPGILCENCVVVSGLMKMTCSLDVLQCRNTPGRFPLTTLTGAIWPDTNCNGTYCGTTWQKVVNISLLICVCVCVVDGSGPSAWGLSGYAEGPDPCSDLAHAGSPAGERGGRPPGHPHGACTPCPAAAEGRPDQHPQVYMSLSVVCLLPAIITLTAKLQCISALCSLV